MWYLCIVIKQNNWHQWIRNSYFPVSMHALYNEDHILCMVSRRRGRGKQHRGENSLWELNAWDGETEQKKKNQESCPQYVMETALQKTCYMMPPTIVHIPTDSWVIPAL